MDMLQIWMKMKEVLLINNILLLGPFKTYVGLELPTLDTSLAGSMLESNP